jgi:hypothetical protein
MCLVQIFNQIDQVSLTQFCSHFGTEGVLTSKRLLVKNKKPSQRLVWDIEKNVPCFFYRFYIFISVENDLF